jgi:hypothetical protein
MKPIKMYPAPFGMNTTPMLPAILALMLSGYCSADELTDAADGLCDTIKLCALEAVAGAQPH